MNQGGLRPVGYDDGFWKVHLIPVDESRYEGKWCVFGEIWPFESDIRG